MSESPISPISDLRSRQKRCMIDTPGHVPRIRELRGRKNKHFTLMSSWREYSHNFIIYEPFIFHTYYHGLSLLVFQNWVKISTIPSKINYYTKSFYKKETTIFFLHYKTTCYMTNLLWSEIHRQNVLTVSQIGVRDCNETVNCYEDLKKR